MRDSRPLVLEYLEGVSRTALQQRHYCRIVRDLVRERHGVYALYHDHRLQYVGLATDLRVRLAQHVRNQGRLNWNRFSVFLTSDNHRLRELEALVLRILRPRGNRQSGRLADSRNLKAELSRRVTVLHDRRRRELLGSAGSGKDGSRPARRGAANGARGRASLAELLPGKHELRGRIHGRNVKAIALPEGTIRYEGREYRTPSPAAAAACRRRSCNGWRFWKYLDDRGRWVEIDRLRCGDATGRGAAGTSRFHYNPLRRR